MSRGCSCDSRLRSSPLWSLVSGMILTTFHGASSGALGAGVSDLAGQRLVGVHLLLLVPVYVLLVVRYDHHRSLLWLPFGAQLAVFLSVNYSILGRQQLRRRRTRAGGQRATRRAVRVRLDH